MTAPTRTTRRAWLVFAAAGAAYLVAIVHRTALGVAGVEALDRFHIGATGLAALSIAQIATYAALQPPAGRLLDKWGPRTMMVAGSLLMAAGQALMAVNHDYKVALVARVLIGAGDAPIFITASRLVAHWFPPRKAPLMVQLTAQIGQLGQLTTAIPVAWLLHAQGWSPTFLTLAGIGVVAAALVSGRARAYRRGQGRIARAVRGRARGEQCPRQGFDLASGRISRRSSRPTRSRCYGACRSSSPLRGAALRRRASCSPCSRSASSW